MTKSQVGHVTFQIKSRVNHTVTHGVKVSVSNFVILFFFVTHISIILYTWESKI